MNAKCIPNEKVKRVSRSLPILAVKLTIIIIIIMNLDGSPIDLHY